nr:reverse transcriptase domain-containing protein [Tanacetum cinerariifolium]GEX95357.1 reverse transcriptase domain-containing protein [Tanacetum cinerariifolium]
ILKKLPEKLRDPEKFLISCSFSEIKCKALADLGASINLMPLSVWKNLGLPELISTRMIFKLANQAICTSAGIARDVFVPVGKFTFPPDYIDVHGGEMILRDGDERLTLNKRHDLPFDIESDLKELEYLLNHDPTKEMDSILEDSIDESNLAVLNDNLFDAIPEMFTDEHTLDYSSPSLYDEYDNDLFELESDNDDAYKDPFYSKKDKIKESKLLSDELDLPRSSDFLPSPEYDSFLFEDFSEVYALPSTNNEDKVFNPGILIHENLSEVIVQATPDKNEKKKSMSHASLILEDFNPPLYELSFHKEVLGSKTLLSFSSKNEEKVFKPEILTSKGVHTSLLPELSYRGPKTFKVIKILESPMEIFPCSFGEDIRILNVLCLHFLKH